MNGTPNPSPPCCPDFPVQSKIVNDIIILEAWRNNDPDYFIKLGGKKYNYCPWCGTKRTNDESIPSN